MKLIGTLTTAALSVGALLASPELTYAATFDQNLQISLTAPATRRVGGETLPIVVGPGTRQPELHAQAKTKTPQPTPATAPNPSSADVINKLLSPGPSDPNVPLPRADLAGEAESGLSRKPQIFGRQEEGGGVFGLRVPIPADRNTSGATTRYSPTPSGLGVGPEGR